MRYFFANYVLDAGRRELRRGAEAVAISPQAFDLLDFLIRHRHRVVSKDDLIAAIWHRRVVSDSALTTRISAARDAIGDTARQHRIIKTPPGRGFRLIGPVREERDSAHAADANPSSGSGRPTAPLPEGPSIAVLPFKNLSEDRELAFFA